MDYPESYELIFQASVVEDDVVIVRRTAMAGAGGYPIYEDETGIVRADAGRVRVADRWCDRLDAPLAIVHKRRDKDVANQVTVHEVVG
ncbi:DUF6296 family protein, partial [Streptomyces sp. GC420]|uniref:DUF6296 family protein n=1 Tax=Streptomyces sp. GC420 TaxID=2697568 RepID=UPI0037DA4AD7